MSKPFHLNGIRICELLKTLYGLKQSGREWNIVFDGKMREFGFHRICSDPFGLTISSYSRHRSWWTYKDYRSWNQPNQRLYNIITENIYQVPPRTRRSNPDGNEGNRSNSFSRLLGELQYLANCTRPDIAFAVNRLASYTANPSMQHFAATKPSTNTGNYVHGFADAAFAGNPKSRQLSHFLQPKRNT